MSDSATAVQPTGPTDDAHAIVGAQPRNLAISLKEPSRQGLLVALDGSPGSSQQAAPIGFAGFNLLAEPAKVFDSRAELVDGHSIKFS